MEEMQSEMNTKLSSLIEKFELLEASLISVTREKEALKVTVAEQAVVAEEVVGEEEVVAVEAVEVDRI